ncbi:gamma-glutamylcyclotransferase family protein [Ovoidimarina sediminis]|uniref:gamma-glutamylcyclotransferase family protein n=1 Tax=Ovoidimarina sediminis TaxID=3079856 RepID=UPI002908E9C5|nr:gamma-glutamylcyclotransferase family protein [Rhodophyticola sp. MJ-SS7]MDU8942967.1 gamma-glutamylcyclotransferase family protein [Rhodophyticola sp. MJ-SS7]
MRRRSQIGHGIGMHDPWFFGYGSLVNRATHAHEDAHKATLTGWRRVWRHTALRPVAFLTAVEVDGGEIDGLIARVPGADWRDLDERERAYDRVQAALVTHSGPRKLAVEVYTIPHGKHGAPDRAHPVLLSYIDVVVQGFLNEYGIDGVARFFDTTDGWDAPIAFDRPDPIYSRHRVLSRKERALVDQHLDEVGARYVEPPKF